MFKFPFSNAAGDANRGVNNCVFARIRKVESARYQTRVPALSHLAKFHAARKLWVAAKVVRAALAARVVWAWEDPQVPVEKEVAISH
jgi:hypothetical protein